MENLPLFISACFALCIVPGPDMALLLSTSLARGKRAGTLAAIGINAGGYVHLLAATLGLSAILMSSAMAFMIVKWMGAAYMVYLGLRVLFLSKSALSPDKFKKPTLKRGNVFWMGFLSDVLNPKVALFFMSFLPQFVSPSSLHPVKDIVLLGVILNVLAILFNLTLVQLAGTISKQLRANEAFTKWLNRTLGVTFLAIGIKIATEKR